MDTAQESPARRNQPVGHLSVHCVELAPGAEMHLPGEGFRFFCVEDGWGYSLTSGSAKELEPGDVIVGGPSCTGRFRASRIGRLRIKCFWVNPALLSGLFTLPEELRLAKTWKESPDSRFFAADHPLAAEVKFLLAAAGSASAIATRCRMIELMAWLLPDNPHPPCEAHRKPLARFRALVNAVPAAEFHSHPIKELAKICDCSERHFGRLMRLHFGTTKRDLHPKSGDGLSS